MIWWGHHTGRGIPHGYRHFHARRYYPPVVRNSSARGQLYQPESAAGELRGHQRVQLQQRADYRHADHSVRGCATCLFDGAINAGTTGFGVTLPSLFTVGVLPHFQVGTEPTQQSPDGLIPANVLNLGLKAPTQTTSVAELLGLPNVGGTLSDDVLTPVFNATAAPVGAQFTNYLDDNVGSWADGSANALKQVTGAIADLSYNLPGATKPEVANNLAPQQLAVTPSGTNTKSTVTDSTRKISNSANAARDRVNTSVTQATKQINDTAKQAGDNLDNIAKKGQDAVKKTVAGATEGAKDTADKAKAGASSK